MRGYAKDVAVTDVPKGHTDVAFDALWGVHDGLWLHGEGLVARELDENYWRGAAYLHSDLTPEELASMLLDGYDVTKETR